MSSKLTAEIQKKIIENLATNPSVPSAAVRAGIAPSTLRDWLAKGEAGHPDFAAFAQEAAQSRAAIKDSVIQALIETASDVHHPQQVRAAAKLLESLYPWNSRQSGMKSAMKRKRPISIYPGYQAASFANCTRSSRGSSLTR